jgi:hypothetical protein
MSLLSDLQDKISYKLHKLTYDPEAEEYNASKKAGREADLAARKAKEREAAAYKKGLDEVEAKKKQKEQEAEDRKARSEFRPGRFFAKFASTLTTVLAWFFTFSGAIYGAHLATNLNLYRSWPYRLLYAIYGFVFFPIVIGYVLGYRWWWKGKKPQYYSLLPMIPYFINHPMLAYLFSWLSYKPDDAIKSLEEWKTWS